MDHSYASREPVFPAAARVLPVWFSAEKAHADAARGGEQGAPSDCVDAAARTDAERLGRASSAETLCAVDHRHDEKRRRAMAAMDALPTLLISWPLRPADKETVCSADTHTARTYWLASKCRESGPPARDVSHAAEAGAT
eukprot:5389746-Pleurochrysis_carterae.AAC.1